MSFHRSTLFFCLLLVVEIMLINSYSCHGATDDTAAGGNVTNLNLSTNATATRWAGIYGQITVNTSYGANTTVILTGGQTTMQNITLPCYADKLYATASPTVDWSNLVAGTAGLVDTYLNISLPDAESATGMFTLNKSFDVPGLPSLNLPLMYTLVYNSTNTTFDLGIINNTRNVTLITHIVQDQTGFDAQNYDYQMLLPVPTLGTTYRLFADCGVCSTSSTTFSFKPVNFESTMSFYTNNTATNFTTPSGNFSNGTLGSTYTGMQPLKLGNSSNTFLEFNYDFGKCQQRNAMDNLIFEKQNSTSTRGSFLVRGITLPSGYTKTIYLDNLDLTSNSICIKDAELTDISEVSSDCSAANETKILCTTEGAAKNGYTCMDQGKMFKVTGANHSGVIEMADDSSGTPGGGGGGTPGGGNAGGGNCPPQMIITGGHCMISSPIATPPSGNICTAGFARIGGICLKPQPAKPMEGELLFNIKIILPPEKKDVSTFETILPLDVTVTKLSNQWIPTDFLLYYVIQDKTGKMVVEDTGEVSVEAESAFIQHLNITALAMGEYNISAYAINGDKYDVDHTNFTIHLGKRNLVGYAGYFWGKTTSTKIKFNWLVLVLMILLLNRGFSEDLFVRIKK